MESSESVLFSRGDAVTLDDAARLRMRSGKFKSVKIGAKLFQVPGVLTGGKKFDINIFNLLCVSRNSKRKIFF